MTPRPSPGGPRRSLEGGGKRPHTANPPSLLRAGPRLRAQRPGVTLTEVIVASALLVLSIVPLLKALTVTQMQDRALERKSWSLLAAQRELELLRARCLSRYDTCYRADSRLLSDGFLCTVDDDAHPVLRTVTVSVGLDADGDGVLAGDEVEVHLSTRLARR
jgi:hypothetical protein